VSHYSVKTGILSEAGEEFLLLAREFELLFERAGSVLSNCPENLIDLRKQLNISKESINEVSRKTRTLGLALYDVIDYYTYAERHAIGGDNRELKLQTPNSLGLKMPNIRNTTSAVLFDRTVLPDWLQTVVLEYEQSQG
jgi:hypothetical protein